MSKEKQYDIAELATMKVFYTKFLESLEEEEKLHESEINFSEFMKNHKGEIPLEVRSWFADISMQKGRELRNRRTFIENRLDEIDRQKYELEAQIMRIYGDDELRGERMIETYQDLYDAKIDEMSEKVSVVQNSDTEN